MNNINETPLYNCIDPTTQETRHASWSKLLATQHAIDLGYDYIVYIDSDCIFRDFNTSLETFIEQSPKKDIVFLNNKPWYSNLPCAGFYISKVCPIMKTFFKDWYATNIPRKNKYHDWEQEALWMIYKNYDVGIVDQWMFREETGQFLRHIGNVEKEKRQPYFQMIIKTLAIDYSTTISTISSIDFNTLCITKLCRLGEQYSVDKTPCFGGHTYTPEYHTLLSDRCNEVKLMLEIGIGNTPLMKSLTNEIYTPGASLRMWRDYFPNAQIVGCDILDSVLFTEDRITTFQTDQSNVTSLKTLMNHIQQIQPYADVILDDGSHEIEHMIISFKELWPLVKPGGMYIIEDIRRPFIEKILNLPHVFGFKDASIHKVYIGKKLWDNFVAFYKDPAITKAEVLV